MTNTPNKGSELQKHAGIIKKVILAMKDPRVSLWNKSLPIIALIYLLSPIDFTVLLAPFIGPLGLLDDAIIVPLLLYLFWEFVPDEVKSESST